ncbi:hypothetical protein ATSB10_31790 [Dyella thiooxydans]|uniref:Uncharacterized protein n=1 Tax=Dyella thiooxydans TaxID=445710 RepID=A0A160N3Q9_9GAMM|nr:hypothetical protein [Dyella thiooxydans]AND70633.1 hypothetical protein ATSB10_31790 [Dyella thiooxydans]
MPSCHPPTCRKQSTPRVTTSLKLKRIGIDRISSAKLLGAGDATDSTLPYLAVAADQARLIQAIYPPVLTPYPDDPERYLALTNTATLQWLLNGMAVGNAVSTKVLALIVECPGWTIEQLSSVADDLAPLVFGRQSARDRRASHRALKRHGITIPREPTLAELMRCGGASPKAKHGR